MRIVFAAALLAVCGASLVVAGGTTTTTVVTTTVTSTTAASSTTSTSTTTSTSSVTATTLFDARECVSDAIDKESCRECCGDGFASLAAACNDEGLCDAAAWDEFVDAWQTAGQYYETCQEDGDIELQFARWAPDSCNEYQGGCRDEARDHPRQCRGVQRCVQCCAIVLTKQRGDRAAKLRAEGGFGCVRPIRCLRTATRKIANCRAGCRRKPTCGAKAVKACLEERDASDASVATCYGKCTEKCGNADSFRWCLQACQATNCELFENCSEIGGEVEGEGCLPRSERPVCDQIITTTSSSSSTTTSSSTTSTIR